METSIKDVDSCKKEFSAELNYDDLKPYFDKALEKQRKTITIPGFRKGKAPLDMVKKKFGDSIEYSSLEDIANEVFINYIVDNKVPMIGRGTLLDIDYKPKEKMTFQINFEVKPELKIENYKGLELTRKKYIIDDSLLEEEINYHRLQNSSLEMDGEAVDDDYVVTLDVQNLDPDGNVIIGQGQNDVKVFLGNKELLPEFSEGLKGIKEEEERVLDTKNNQGEPQKVKLTAKKIEKVVYPEMTEEFFKKVTGKDDLKTEKDFRSTIKEELEKIYENSSKQKLTNDIINEIIKLNEIEVPDTFVNTILDSHVEDYKKKLPKGQKLTDEQVEQIRQERKVEAILQAKWFLTREKIAELENVTVEDKDYEEMANENAERFNIPADKLVEVYKNNKDLEASIVNNKVIDFLINNAKITEEEEVKKYENAGVDESGPKVDLA